MSPGRFDAEWAREKLNMPRRRRELTAHIARWLPELATMPPGVVIDIGTGPGDFIALCCEMGHTGYGIDAPEGRGGMGDSYLALCRQERKRLNVDVSEVGLIGWLDHMAGQPRSTAPVCCIHSRGAIEQALAIAMVGREHHEHHDCRLLDWDHDLARVWFGSLMWAADKLLCHGGILLIAANGTKSTDSFYDEAICGAADSAGLNLTDSQRPLTHKWIKPAQ